MNSQWKGKEYYDDLGISKDATQVDIKKAYRKLSLKYHPDKLNGDPNKFKKINEAYQVLSNETTRKQYDQRGIPHGNFRIFQNGKPVNVHTMNDMEGMGIPEDILNMMFQHGMKFSKPTKPQPISKTLSISLEQAYTGCSIPITIERWILSEKVKTMEQETVYIDIPPGIDSNEIIIMKEKGNQSDQHSQSGDVRIHIRIQPHSLFNRKGLSLLYQKQITMRQALCGFEFELNHLNGKTYKVRNDPGTIVQSGNLKVIQGLGFQRGTHKGHLHIQFQVKYPHKIPQNHIEELDSILKKIEENTS